MSDLVPDPWQKLRAATPARIGLGRSGAALTTGTHLGFQHAHARARDAVHRGLDLDRLVADLAPLEVLRVQSAAGDRATYLRRPDLGRQLGGGDWPGGASGNGADVAIVIADGLSADAVQTHAAGVAGAVHKGLTPYTAAPIVVASQARVAIGDEICQRLGARLVIVLIGERPGLTVADSLGAYITYGPTADTMDSARNCVSNIHGQGGLSRDEAARKILWITKEALRRELTGTGLKEAADALPEGADAARTLPR